MHHIMSTGHIEYVSTSYIMLIHIQCGRYLYIMITNAGTTYLLKKSDLTWEGGEVMTMVLYENVFDDAMIGNDAL